MVELAANDIVTISVELQLCTRGGTPFMRETPDAYE